MSRISEDFDPVLRFAEFFQVLNEILEKTLI